MYSSPFSHGTRLLLLILKNKRRNFHIDAESWLESWERKRLPRWLLLLSNLNIVRKHFFRCKQSSAFASRRTNNRLSLYIQGVDGHFYRRISALDILEKLLWIYYNNLRTGVSLSVDFANSVWAYYREMDNAQIVFSVCKFVVWFACKRFFVN